MNWFDWVLIALFCWAAFSGFRRGLLVELAALVALVLGIWAGIHFSDRVAAAIGLDPERTAVAFLVTLVAVLIAVHLLARALTKAVDLALLGMPNRITGALFALLRSLFLWSVLFNLLAGWSDGRLPPADVRQGSALYGPVRATAPFLLPDLGETKWVMQVVDQLKQEAEELAR
jgi:membrane protein required for colicin V production